MATELDRLAAEQYVLLTTFRKDGRSVPTPVWAARDGSALVVWTAASSGKVKRIRRDRAVQVAPCDRRGEQQGKAAPADARLIDSSKVDEVDRALLAIKRKYGLLGRILVTLSRLRRGRDGLAIIVITFAELPDAAN
jgi:uncharacterized protein